MSKRKKTMMDFLKKEAPDFNYVQGKLDHGLFVQCRKLMRDDKLTWDDIITAAVRTYITEKEQGAAGRGKA